MVVEGDRKSLTVGVRLGKDGETKGEREREREKGRGIERGG